MLTRRRFTQSLALLAGGLCSQNLRPVHAQSAQPSWRMPDEGEAHLRTWMAFGASKAIWGSKLLPVVQRNLATIAKTIARYERPMARPKRRYKACSPIAKWCN